MTWRLTFLPILTAALVVPASIGFATSAEAATARCAGFKATIVGTNASQKITGTSGRDVIVARGGNDVIDARGGQDFVCGGTGNDTIRSGSGTGGLLYGEDGRDLVIAQADGVGVYGGNHDDTLRTSRRGTLLEGGAGNDVVVGGSHADVIDGGSGNDRISAAGGNDRLVTGGPGADSINGGSGTDTLRGGSGNDVISPATGVGGFAYGDAGNDTLAAGDDGQALYGGADADLLKTAWEGTLLEGGTGDDRIFGGAFADTITGGDGNDRISAGGGDDVDLNAGFGVDTCDGGPGNDRCHGGAPGGPANSPTDPDICTAEVTESCKGDEFPQRWLAKVTGRETTDIETRTWELSMVLVRHGDPSTTTTWKQESVSGSFSVRGQDHRCVWSHDGGLGSRDFSGDLGLVPGEDLYWLDVVAGGYGERLLSCEGGAPSSTRTSYEAWGATGGGPDAIAWDRTRREITGTWEDPDGYPARDIDWVITPLD
ncbi:hypothetical protein ASE01_14455 [Nocardioides sp. Root190]|uniref:calcium-binding protein n=1 Tax=Nocardioides sp. Root190 TaxID=1736488 RepID=UPI0007019D87|nr:calcium-binding protein [Nocardioides sp. Root190]KRB76213.1 hypothetical protein ASE01_14455 [Nocardioides sp. Root190]